MKKLHLAQARVRMGGHGACLLQMDQERLQSKVLPLERSAERPTPGLDCLLLWELMVQSTVAASETSGKSWPPAPGSFDPSYLATKRREPPFDTAPGSGICSQARKRTHVPIGIWLDKGCGEARGLHPASYLNATGRVQSEAPEAQKGNQRQIMAHNSVQDLSEQPHPPSTTRPVNPHG